MTVCIAAVARLGDEFAVVGASDRMLTTGDVEFEPPQTKIFTLNRHIVALVAGDMSEMLAVCRGAYQRIAREGVQESVQAGEVFAEVYRDLWRERAEQAVLHPVGIAWDDWATRQADLADPLVRHVLEGLRDFSLGGAALVAGVYEGVANITQVQDPGVWRLESAVGFSAIGYGSRHALSQFQMARYTNKWHMADALWMCYLAKRRSEVAPSVGGDGTDLFFLTSEKGIVPIGQKDGMKEFEKIYERFRKGEDRVFQRSQGRVSDYVREFLAPGKG